MKIEDDDAGEIAEDEDNISSFVIIVRGSK